MSHTKQQSSTTNIDWDQLNAEWDASPLSQKNFCRKKDISYSLFICKRAYWLKKRKRTPKQKFVPVTVVPLKTTKADSALSLTLPSGACLEIPLNVDVMCLKPILNLLGVIC